MYNMSLFPRIDEPVQIDFELLQLRLEGSNLVVCSGDLGRGLPDDVLILF